MTVTAVRNETSVPVHGPIAQRWSPRSLDIDFDLSNEDFGALQEAARWAPSAMNLQPTRLIVARRGTGTFAAIASSLAGFNQAWAPRASALIVALAEVERDGQDIRWAEYDLGQSIAHLSIEAASRGLVTHQMGGFDGTALTTAFDIPGEFRPVTVVAVGRYDDEADVAAELRERDLAPRTRRNLEDLTLILDI